ncbi:MAG TPA: TIGR01777 family oxidoreductase [Bryobacteraceae bacterium]|nr:TIGR01777 family oxidoreductase [Bryobacteraceae bacterium]
MNIAITGASGFLGRHVAERLRQHSIRAVSTRTGVSARDFAGCDAVIHLAGEPVAQRWTPQVRERIRTSRVDGTRAVVEAMRRDPPKVLLSASAIGYYGSRGDEILNESAKPGDDFLARTCLAWEREAFAAEQFGVRVAALRISLALGRDGGALQKMLLPFRLGAGGRLGAGTQWMSWIHVDDLAEMFAFALENDVRGVWNAASPNPVTNAGFTRELGGALHRPAILPVPAFALKILFGEMAGVILGSQRAVPEAALHAGFSFRFADLSAALRDLVGFNRQP